MKLKAKEVIDYLKIRKFKYEFIGGKEIELDSFSSVKKLNNNSITWIKNVSIFDFSTLECNTDLLIVCNKVNIDVLNSNFNFIFCENPKEVFFVILEHFFSQEKYEDHISPSANVVSKKIGKNVYIGNNSYVGSEVQIDDYTVIKNNVSLEGKIRIGKHTIVHSGVVIGTDGFGYYEDNLGNQKKVPHYGGVIIGDNVEIGANTCIDRGVIEDTEIGNGVKISNNCNISHNVVIGENVLITAGSLINGSTKIGKGSYLAPGTIIRNQLEIGENSYIGMGAVVVKNVEKNVLVTGIPAKIIKRYGDNK